MFFPFTIPALDLLFPPDGGADIEMLLKVNQLGDAIFRGKALGVDMLPVLLQPAAQVVGDAGVNGSVRPIAEDIDITVHDPISGISEVIFK